MHCIIYVVAEEEEAAENEITQLIEGTPEYTYDGALKLTDSTRYNVDYVQSIETATQFFRVGADKAIVDGTLYDSFEDAEVSDSDTVYAFDVHY